MNKTMRTFTKTKPKRPVLSGQLPALGLLAFADMEAERLERTNRLSLAENYRCAQMSFRRYLVSRGQLDVPLSDVDCELMTGYQDWLLASGLKKNTTSCYMRSLQAMFNKAVARDPSLACLSRVHPFATVYTGVYETRRIAVDSCTVKRLHGLDIRAGLVGLGKRPGTKTFLRQLRELTFARDTFIFCFCCRGLPFVDFAFLRRENLQNGYLCYERHKTGQHIQAELLPLMKAFIAKYATGTPFLFPVLTTTSARAQHRQYQTALHKYNRQLRLLSEMMGSSVQLSSYVARHTWATTAYHEDIPVAYISEAMGHTSEQTTRKYLKSLGSSKIDQANRKLMDGIFEMSTS